MATLGLEEADSKMHVQRTGSGYEAVQTDVGGTTPQYPILIKESET